MKQKRKQKLRFCMLIITLFSVSFAVTYTALLINDRKEAQIPDHSNTMYRRLETEGFTATAKDMRDSIAEDNTEVKQSEKAENLIDNGQKRFDTVRVLDAESGSISEMALEDYVSGVVLAEMSVGAPAEAMKAQAVASRTLAVRFICDTNKSAHDGADICTSAAHCQAYTGTADFARKYGDAGIRASEAAKNASLATKGIILLYGGEPIVAAFHASSGDKTASSKEAWGGDVAYLVSVETNELYNSILEPSVVSSISFTKDNLLRLLKKAGVKGTDSLLSRPFSEWLSGVTRTESGRVDFIEINGERLKGDFIRKALGLKSSSFTFSYTEDTITFKTVGYGHGVGMSQLGAISMALEGASFYKILDRYYPGCTAGLVG